jgi:membrane glycosyltransferase
MPAFARSEGVVHAYENFLFVAFIFAVLTLVTTITVLFILFGRLVSLLSKRRALESKLRWRRVHFHAVVAYLGLLAAYGIFVFYGATVVDIVSVLAPALSGVFFLVVLVLVDMDKDEMVGEIDEESKLI